MTKFNAHDVALWMLDKLQREQSLYQQTVIFEIQTKFGDEFTCINNNGNLVIGKGVLAEFKKLTDGQVVWIKSDKYWRFREDFDELGKRAAD